MIDLEKHRWWWWSLKIKLKRNFNNGDKVNEIYFKIKTSISMTHLNLKRVLWRNSIARQLENLVHTHFHTCTRVNLRLQYPIFLLHYLLSIAECFTYHPTPTRRLLHSNNFYYHWEVQQTSSADDDDDQQHRRAREFFLIVDDWRQVHVLPREYYNINSMTTHKYHPNNCAHLSAKENFSFYLFFMCVCVW